MIAWAGDRITLEKPCNALVLGDLHAPYMHEDYLEFAQDVYKKYNCTRVYAAGDVGDNYYPSKYPKNIDAPPNKELRNLTEVVLAELESVFGHIRCIIGNHCRRILNALDEGGLGTGNLSINQLLTHFGGYPSTWSYYDLIYIKGDFQETQEDIIIMHGDQKGFSPLPHINLRSMDRSIVYGHHHASAGIAYNCSNLRRKFSMNVGCGVDTTEFVFNYARENLKKDILSCGVILGLDGIFVPMPLRLDKNKKVRYDRGRF